ncbi:hypothetical protein PCASD_12089 [Puccinia coronata f. sp. avenae]|uniref:Mediator of RNA polymerase II transcription subunit 1 n=1 Tax=Puccinia coronata f. sp. avenae TaxID=200324 RepID=A0A2N5UEQ6_9BASI|nr:hypothetical protein PCASD_12089 [Puccinia coronata f. sp. avenae]
MDLLKNSLIYLSHDSTRKLEEALKNINQEEYAELHLHPLSVNSNNINNLRTELTQSFSTITQSLSQYKQLIQQTTPQATQTTHTTQTTQASSIIKILRQSTLHLNSLIQSESFIEQLNHLTAKQKKRSTYQDPSLIIEKLTEKYQSTIPLIEALAKEVGLEYFRDSEDSNLLTIAGKLFVIDIELEETQSNGTHSNPKVNKSKFSYTFAEEEAKRDVAIDQELTQQLEHIHHVFQCNPPHSYCQLAPLQLVQSSLEAFAASLKQLKELDELMSSSQSNQIDYFMVFRSLISDYHELLTHTQDQLSCPIKLPPSGIPISSVNQLKLELIYHYNSTDLLNNIVKLIKEPHQKKGSAISVTLTATTTTPSSQNEGKGIFTARFHPPLAVSRHTAAALAQVSAIDLQPCDNTAPSYDSLAQDTPARPHDISLEDVLVYQAMTSGDDPRSIKRDWDIQTSHWKSKQFGKVMDARGPSLVFSFLDAHDDAQESSNSRLGVLVTQVPFDNLDSLLKIIQICQRQSIFNELFNSCFNPDCYLSKNHTPPHNPTQQQRAINQIPDQEREKAMDPFEGFYASDYLDTLVRPSPAHHHPSALPISLETNNCKEDVSIDVVVDHAAYSITLQFISSPTRPNDALEQQNQSSSGLGDPIPSKDDSHDHVPLGRGGEWEDEDGFKMNSLTFAVSDQGHIALNAHSSTLDNLPVPANFTAAGLSDLLQESLNRTRCLPVILASFCFPSG